MEYNVIHQGDCIEVMKSFPDESVDLIFADPPYFMQTSGELHRTNGDVFDGVKDEWDKFSGMDDYEKFTHDWLKECKRVLKKDGAIWVIGSFQNIYTMGHIMLKLGYWVLNDVVWSKPNAVPNFSGSRFQNSHETLLWCSKSKKSRYQFNYQTMKELNGGKQMKSVWDIGICIGNERLKDENGKKVHSTQKPEKLLENIILSTTIENDIVLDPFFGTGTTGAIAKKFGRKFIGIEMDPYYIKHATDRINSVETISNEFTRAEFDIKPPKVSTEKLISENYLSVGEKLYDKHGKHVANLSADGGITVVEDGFVASIHKGSAHILGKSNNNGWDYFYFMDGEKLTSINDLRYRYDSDHKKR